MRKLIITDDGYVIRQGYTALELRSLGARLVERVGG